MFRYMCMCVYVWCVHMSASGQGIQRRASDPLKLEIQGIIATLWVLCELRTSERAVCAFQH